MELEIENEQLKFENTRLQKSLDLMDEQRPKEAQSSSHTSSQSSSRMSLVDAGSLDHIVCKIDITNKRSLPNDIFYQMIGVSRKVFEVNKQS